MDREIPPVIVVEEPVLVNEDVVESVPTFAEQAEQLFGDTQGEE